MTIDTILEKQRKYFVSGATLPVKFRIGMLKKLYNTVKKYEKEIAEALKADLGKSDFEAFMCETGMVLAEIGYMIKHTRKFASNHYVWSPLAQFASIHLATSEMGFGGVGESGMGSYHGKEGFDVFSHTKSIVDKKTWMDLPMRYQPYNRGIYAKLLHIFLK